MASNKFVNTSDVNQSAFLNFRQYFKISENLKEFMLSNMWQMFFIKVPRAVYYPGDDLINMRLKSANPAFDNAVATIDVSIHGFQLSQATRQHTFGTIALTLHDRVDQGISAWVDDWKQKESDRNTQFTYKKEDVVADIRLLMFDNQRIPIREFFMYTCLPTDAALNESAFTDEDPADISDVTLNLKFEHYERNFLNI
jgi:hypothetical protein